MKKIVVSMLIAVGLIASAATTANAGHCDEEYPDPFEEAEQNSL